MQDERYQQAKKVTLIGALVNALLGIFKISGGLLFHSHSLIADGFHSFSDLLTDSMVLFASKFGSVDADESHPYGHQRIETAATLFLSLLLILVGIGIGWDALDELLKGTHTIPQGWSIPVILISIIANEALFRYTHHVGKKIQSELILANAWHHRSDSASSLVVLLGILGSMLGLIYLDALAATVVAGLIVKMGWDYGWNSVKELIDTAVAIEMLEEIQKIILSIQGVEKVHQLRTRSMGGDVYIDVHILVAPRISVSEGHYIAQHVHQALVDKIEKVKDVIVHVDPEDDEVGCPSFDLPNRKVLEETLFRSLRSKFPELQFWNLHYEDGKMTLDLVYPQPFEAWEDLQRETQSLQNQYPYIKEFRLLSLHCT